MKISINYLSTVSLKRCKNELLNKTKKKEIHLEINV